MHGDREALSQLLPDTSSTVWRRPSLEPYREDRSDGGQVARGIDHETEPRAQVGDHEAGEGGARHPTQIHER